MLFRLITNIPRSLAFVAVAVIFAAGARAADPVYLSAVADLPLPPGLVEEVDAGISFDKPEGRIIEAIASGTVARSDVVAFYQTALPGLGWQPLKALSGNLRWQRGDEILSVDIVDSSIPLVVRFSIAPR